MENLSLDTREVLSVLNEMGYRNITPSQLKEFTKDLRKLIKYEKQIGLLNSQQKATRDPFAELHRATTASFTAKNVKRKSAEPLKPSQSINRPVKQINKPIKSTDPIHTMKIPAKTQKRPLVHKTTQDNAGNPPNRMWIRPKSACATSHVRDNDPVKLYQYYKNEWEKHKKSLPGENSHAELRWQIRNKLLGCEK